MIRCKAVIIACSLVLALGLPMPAQGQKAKKLPEGVKVLAGLVYAERPTGKLELDLYLPTSKPARPLPVVVWVHGGGWNKGSKASCPAVYLAAEGYAVASINYRLTTVAKWPAQIDDCHEAVRWLRTNAASHHLDAKHIGAWGSSAGGHLVALMGTLPTPADEKVSSRVQAVCDFFGPTDLLTMPPNLPDRPLAQLEKANGALLLGGVVKDHPDKAKAASAYYHTAKDNAPFLIVHGDKDPAVPLAQSQRFAAKLKESGATVTLRILPGAAHGGKEFQTPEVRRMVREFFDRHLKAE
jgi:acetyl esterase/lipase